ncbi:hypothetical protein Vretimale_11453 [Volvox reticuliferus]|uniref:Uncharacterized protein n=1 Tax=Volvox reticuliferus TaxID=1737510 RepID=A0A8J4LSC6_9CHLO|nr:hypothetical protein Vretifemale_11958 [Volvox reticuliferus]GIM07254.1 hypothetical protein Vretimale_11453 [Volvox reticuliferus]
MRSRCRRSDAATGVNDRYLHLIAISLAVAAGGFTLALGIVGKGRRRGRQDRGKVTQCTGSACKVAIHESNDQTQFCPERRSEDASWDIQAHLRDVQASPPDCSLTQGVDGLDTRDSDTDTHTDATLPTVLESPTAAGGVVSELRTDGLACFGHVQLGFEPVANAPTTGELVYPALYDTSVNEHRLSSGSEVLFTSLTTDTFTASGLPCILHDCVHSASTLTEQPSAKSWASADGVSLDGLIQHDDGVIDPYDSREGFPSSSDGLDILFDSDALQRNDGLGPPDAQNLLTPAAEALRNDALQVQVAASTIFGELQEGLILRTCLQEGLGPPADGGLQEGLILHGEDSLVRSHLGERCRRHNGGIGDGGLGGGDDGGSDDCERPPGPNLDLDTSSRVDIIAADTNLGSPLDTHHGGNSSDVAISGGIGAGRSSCCRLAKIYNGRGSALRTEDASTGSCLNDFRSSLEVNGGVDVLVTVAIGNPLFAKDAPNTPIASAGPSASRVGWRTASPASHDAGPAANSASFGNTVGGPPHDSGDGHNGRARRHLSFAPVFFTIDNPCFVGAPAATVFNPCFSAAEWGGAVPAVNIDLPAYTADSAAGLSGVGGSDDVLAAETAAAAAAGRVRWHPCNPLAAAAAAATAAGMQCMQGGPSAAAVAAALQPQQLQPVAAGTMTAMMAAVDRSGGELQRNPVAVPFWGQCLDIPYAGRRYAANEQQQQYQGQQQGQEHDGQRLGARTSSISGEAAAAGVEVVETEVVKDQKMKATYPLASSDLAAPMTPAKQPPPLAAPLPTSPTSPISVNSTSPLPSLAAEWTPRPPSEISDPIATASAVRAAAVVAADNIASVSSTAAAATAPTMIEACGGRGPSRHPNLGHVPGPARCYSRPRHQSPRPAVLPLSSSPARQQQGGQHHVEQQQQRQLICGSPEMSARSALTGTGRSTSRGPPSAATTAGASSSPRRPPWRPTTTTGTETGTGSAAKSSWPAVSADNGNMNPAVTAATTAADAFTGNARCGGMQRLLVGPAAAAMGAGPLGAATARPPFRPASKYGRGFQPIARGGGGETTKMTMTAAAAGLIHVLADCKLAEGVSNLPSYMRPTQASLAAASWGGSGGGGSSKSTARPRGGGDVMAAVGERKAQDRQDPNRPRWR